MPGVHEGLRRRRGRSGGTASQGGGVQVADVTARGRGAVLREGDALPWLCTVTIVAALVLGGGTIGSTVGDAVAELVAIPLLITAIRRFVVLRPAPAPWRDGVVALGIVLVPLAQAVPVPAWIWTACAGHALREEALRIAGVDSGAYPLSLDPDATRLAVLSLIVPLGLFFGVRLLAERQRHRVVHAVVGVTIVSVLLGLAQMAGGADTTLRLFRGSNPTDAVGFFANRNHFAALLYVGFLLTGAGSVDAAVILAARDRPHGVAQRAVIACAIGLPLMGLFGVTELLTRSRAGVGLMLAAGIVLTLLYLTDRGHRRRRIRGLTVGAVGAAALLLAAQARVGDVLDRLNLDLSNDTRLVLTRATAAAARDFLPFGSGIGTFRSVYAIDEATPDLIVNTHHNQAHDDLVQLWLEAGVPAMMVLALVIAWLAWRMVELWRRPAAARGAGPPAATLPRAAFVAIVLLLAHSLADYPLRTIAGMSLFAVCCALVTRPPGGWSTGRQVRHGGISDQATETRPRDARARRGWRATLRRVVRMSRP